MALEHLFPFKCIINVNDISSVHTKWKTLLNLGKMPRTRPPGSVETLILLACHVAVIHHVINTCRGTSITMVTGHTGLLTNVHTILCVHLYTQLYNNSVQTYHHEKSNYLKNLYLFALDPLFSMKHNCTQSRLY